MGSPAAHESQVWNHQQLMSHRYGITSSSWICHGVILTLTVEELTYAYIAMVCNHSTCATLANALTLWGTTARATPMPFSSDHIKCSSKRAAWASELKNHPDLIFVNKLLTGMCEGVDIGFERLQQLRLHDKWPL